MASQEFVNKTVEPDHSVNVTNITGDYLPIPVEIQPHQQHGGGLSE